MLKICDFKCSGRVHQFGVPDSHPEFSWKLKSDHNNVLQSSYRLKIITGGETVWDSGRTPSRNSVFIRCGVGLKPYTLYTAHVEVTDNTGDHAEAETEFYSGKLTDPWSAEWIGTGRKNPSDNSLPPEVFKKTFHLSERPTRAALYISALGIYDVAVNGERVSDVFFAPGYSNYCEYVQFQAYDVTQRVAEGENDLSVTVANGWYLGTIIRFNNNYGDCRGLIAELRLEFSDHVEVIGTDATWESSVDSPERYADFYNGETIDQRLADRPKMTWEPCIVLTKDITLVPHFSAYVREDSRLEPISLGNGIYDFKQNHAGVIHLLVEAEEGTVITVRHGELLTNKGSLLTENLRSAKQTLTLVCAEGVSEFLPRFTFMGFRYIELSSDRPVKIRTLESVVLTSDSEKIGEFSCSNPLLTRLQQNIQWSQRSNFIEIPTDCPQRDERLGWTGDIAVFSQAAAFNRDIRAFMKKWLRDLRQFQYENGAIPITIPEAKPYQPTPTVVPIAIWGDAATMVPWAVYRAYGDVEMLREQYESMRRYVDAELAAAAEHGRRKEKYLWNKSIFQYGDWCAPGETVTQWSKKGDHLATAYLANSLRIVTEAAKVLGKADDEKFYTEKLELVRDAFVSLCVNSDGTFKGDFESNYVCALYFGLIPDDMKPAAAKRLSELVREGGYKIKTGFAGTPYIAFALADNGYVEDAYKLLLNQECPGWLYTVKAGGTTIWERWDALREDGTLYAEAKSNMISFNHYAYGAVGDFLYRRIAGIEPLEPGYRSFLIKPVIGSDLDNASASLMTGYGRIVSEWHRVGGNIRFKIVVPENTECLFTLPDGAERRLGSGEYEFGWRY